MPSHPANLVMSYHRSKTGLGDVAGATKTLLSGVSTAVDIGNDPYLAETICRAEQLVAIENKKTLPTCATTPGGLRGGIGLRTAMPMLRGLVYAQQHKWVYPAAVAAVVGVPLLAGILIGKAMRRR